MKKVINGLIYAGGVMWWSILFAAIGYGIVVGEPEITQYDLVITYQNGETEKAYTHDRECFLLREGCLECQGQNLACGVRRFEYISKPKK